MALIVNIPRKTMSVLIDHLAQVKLPFFGLQTEVILGITKF